MSWDSEFVVFADVYLDGGRTVKRVATRNVHFLQAGALRVYDGVITGSLPYTVTAGNAMLGQASSTTFGQMTLLNQEGQLTEWFNHDYAGADVVLRMGDIRSNLSLAPVVGVARIRDMGVSDMNLVIQLRSVDEELDRFTQEQVYTVEEAAAYPSIEGRPLPYCVGDVLLAQLQLTNDIDLHYQLNDTGVPAYQSVLSNGVPADPPGGPVDPEWEPLADGTGIQMLVSSFKALRTYATGASLYSHLIYHGNFDDSDQWGFTAPIGWDEVTPGIMTHEFDIGMGLTAPPTSDGLPGPAVVSTPLGVVAGWYVVCLRVLVCTAGTVELRHNGDKFYSVSREGYFFAPFYAPVGGGTLELSFNEDGCNAVLQYCHIYRVDDGKVSDSQQPFQVVRSLLMRTGVRDLQIDSGSLAAVTSALPTRIGRQYFEPVRLRDALADMLYAYDAYYYVETDGVFRFGRMQDSLAPYEMVLDSTRLSGLPSLVLEMAPGLSAQIAGGQHQAPYTEADIQDTTEPVSEGSPPPPAPVDLTPLTQPFLWQRRSSLANLIRHPYTAALGAAPIGSPFLEPTAGTPAIDRIVSGHTAGPRMRVAATFCMDTPAQAVALSVGTSVLLRGSEFGPLDNTQATVISRQGDLNDNRVTVVARTSNTAFRLTEEEDLRVTELNEAPRVLEK